MKTILAVLVFVSAAAFGHAADYDTGQRRHVVERYDYRVAAPPAVVRYLAPPRIGAVLEPDPRDRAVLFFSSASYYAKRRVISVRY